MSRFAFVAVLMLAAYLATGVTLVQPGERAVVRRFGRVVARPGPGPFVGLPWGCDRVDRVSLGAARQVVVGESALLTGDRNLVALKLVVEYAPDGSDAGLDAYIVDRDRVEQVLALAAESLAGEWAAARSVDRVLLTGAAELPAWLAPRLRGRVPGIEVRRVSVESASPPAEVREAFAAVGRAQAEAATRQNQARQAAERRLREAETLRDRLAREAGAGRTEKLAMADADAAAFLARLASFRTGPGTAAERLRSLWWDEAGRALLALKQRGRLEPLDHRLGPNGIDFTQTLDAGRKPPE